MQQNKTRTSQAKNTSSGYIICYRLQCVIRFVFICKIFCCDNQALRDSKKAGSL